MPFSPSLLIAALIAAASFGSAWKIQDWRYDAKEKERVEQQLENERLAAKAATAEKNREIAARDAATNRERVLRMDAANARSALVGLSNDTAEAMRAAASSHLACIDRATALSELLNQCGERYTELAAKADRHANDVKTLTDTWPK